MVTINSKMISLILQIYGQVRFHGILNIIMRSEQRLKFTPANTHKKNTEGKIESSHGTTSKNENHAN